MKLIKIAYVILIVIILLGLSKNQVFAEPSQTVTLSRVYGNHLYCYCFSDNQTIELMDFGSLSNYDLDILPGTYFIVWSGDVNADDQSILEVITR